MVLSAVFKELHVRKIAVLTGLSLLMVCSLQAGIEQKLEKPDSLYLGSRFYLHITSDAELEDVIVPDTLTKFVVLDKQKTGQKDKQKGIRLTLAALDTGEHTFPALLVKPVKSVMDSLKTKPFTVIILEARAPADSLLVDIAPTYKLKGELPYWAYYLIAAVLILALLITVILLICKYRKRKEVTVQTQPVVMDERPNWKKALDSLYQLKEENLPPKGEFIIYHYRLSEILKLFLEAEYRFSANEMTSREIRQFLRKHDPVSMTEQKEITDWLDGCDKVKFAKVTPSIEECDMRMDWMVNWLMEKSKITEQETTGEKNGN
ncbi:MAG: hypothetical protein FJ041_02510 [Candidatus Cloacimonetes bacterium]|nr:hypothetical protein [Candidatus Cloacimonadota bacterium]